MPRIRVLIRLMARFMQQLLIPIHAQTHDGDHMKICTALFAIVSALLVHASPAHAEHRPPLYNLALRYESAVENFEKTVLQVRGIDRADERLVDRLDDDAARFRLAARNPRHLNKLFNEWDQIQKLHAQVEARIFGKYTPNHELIYGWDVVVYQYDLFAQELLYHVENQRHGNSVQRIASSNAWRDRYFQSAASANAPPASGPPPLPTPPSGR